MNGVRLGLRLELFAACCVVVGALVGTARADINVLTIGDSLTQGSNGASGTGPGGLPVPDRSTYRPYLWQTATNYLNNLSDTNGVTIDFVGTRPTGLQVTPTGGDTPITIDPGWDKNHQGTGGATAQSFARRTDSRFIGKTMQTLAAQAGDNTPDVAIILLSTNDLAIIDDHATADGFAESLDVVTPTGSGFSLFSGQTLDVPTGPLADTDTGFLRNQLDVMNAVNHVQTVATTLRDGADLDGNGSIDVPGNPLIKVLILAIPPVDERQRYNGGGPEMLVPDVANLDPFPVKNSFLWTENDRETIIDTDFNPNSFEQDFVTNTGGGNSFGAPFEESPEPSGGSHTGANNGTHSLSNTDTNHVIGVINDQLQEFTTTNDPSNNFIFVNPFESTHLVDSDGSLVPVDGGGTFDMGGTNRGTWNAALNGGSGAADNPNHDLADGLHLNFTGDQYYAGNIWDAPGGLKAIINSAVGVPEPSSFAFLGLVAVVGGVAKRIRSKRRAA